MTKLKTLKDFYPTSMERSLLIEELKAEAIKWVKYMESEDYSESIVDGADRAEWCACLKTFHNITEEDLK